MINKKDLVKDFEEATKQLIKNHNDEILQSNLSINEFKKSLEGQKSFFLKKIQDLYAKIDDLQASNEEGKKKALLYHQNHTSMMNNLGSIKELISRLANDTSSGLDDAIQRDSDLQKHLQEVRDQISLMQRSQHSIQKDLYEYQARWEAKLSKGIAALDHEMSSRPSPLIPEIDALKKRIEEGYIDFKGVTKELETLKKRLFRGEKHLEFVVNNINRLKKASQIPKDKS